MRRRKSALASVANYDQPGGEGGLDAGAGHAAFPDGGSTTFHRAGPDIARKTGKDGVHIMRIAGIDILLNDRRQFDYHKLTA